MNLKLAHAEIRDLAARLSVLPVPEALELSTQLLTASLVMADAEALPEADDSMEAVENLLDSQAERFPKGSAWWMPPHNFALNETLLGGFNAWRFTILPMFPKKRAYNEALQGIVIHPVWVPVGDNTIDVSSVEMAQKVLAVMRKASTIQEDVRQELTWIERQFSIRIPEDIKGGILKDALPTAKRRWKVDRLRLKNRLIPLDGSPARDLGAFE